MACSALISLLVNVGYERQFWGIVCQLSGNQDSECLQQSLFIKPYLCRCSVFFITFAVLKHSHFLSANEKCLTLCFAHGNKVQKSEVCYSKTGTIPLNLFHPQVLMYIYKPSESKMSKLNNLQKFLLSRASSCKPRNYWLHREFSCSQLCFLCEKWFKRGFPLPDFSLNYYRCSPKLACPVSADN